MVGGNTGSSQASKSRLVNQTFTMPYLRVIQATNSIRHRAYRRRFVPHERIYHPLLHRHAAVGRAAAWEIWGNRERIVTICATQLISYASYSTIKAHSVWCDGVGSSHSTFFRWQRRKHSERSVTNPFTVGFFRKETKGDPSLFEGAVWVFGKFPVNGCTGRSKVLWGSMVGLWVTIPVSRENKRVSCRLAQLCIPTIEEIVIALQVGFLI